MNRGAQTSLTLILLLACIQMSLRGQGVIAFNNSGASAEQKVYVDEWLNPASLAPGGGQFLVALYFSPVDGDESSLNQVGSAIPTLGTAEQRYGLFFGGERTVSTVYVGGAGYFQVRGWEASYGNTYEEALANQSARTGKSPIFIADTADRFIALEPAPNLVAGSFPERPFRGFVIAVPEPSTGVLILAGVGAGVVVVCARRGKRAVGRDKRSSFFGKSPGSESGRGLPHSKTCRSLMAFETRASVLDCGSPLLSNVKRCKNVRYAGDEPGESH